VAASATVRFFYRTVACDDVLNAGVSVPGTSIVATDQTDDISLLMVRGALPSGVTWAGWMTSTPAVGTSCVCLHHPNGYPQAISFGVKTGTSGACPLTASTFTVNWNLGVTEGGSSGGGLYDESSQLLFGLLSCGTTSCFYQGGWDGFSRWDLALSAGGFAPYMLAGSDDTFEPNNTCATATPLVSGAYSGLIVKRLSPDWYAIDVPQGASLNVRSTYSNARGDLDFRLWGACGDAEPLADALGDIDNESFSFVNTTGGTTLLLEVFLSTGTRNDYALEVSISPPCAADLDGDGEVSSGDIAIMLLEFGTCAGCDADLDGDGQVSAGDIALLLLSFGPCQ
jgi:hypothetical protein